MKDKQEELFPEHAVRGRRLEQEKQPEIKILSVPNKPRVLYTDVSRQ